MGNMLLTYKFSSEIKIEVRLLSLTPLWHFSSLIQSTILAQDPDKLKPQLLHHLYKFHVGIYLIALESLIF